MVMSRSKKAATKPVNAHATTEDASGRRAVFKFVIVFVLLVLLGSGAEMYVDRNHLGADAQRWIAGAVGWTLKLLSVPANVHGTSISVAQGSVDVAAQCIGIQATVIFWAGVIGFPRSRRGLVVGIVTGLIGVQLLNMARIGVLGMVNGYRPDWFETLHSVLMQGFLVVFVAPLWILWMVWVIRRDPAWAAPLSDGSPSTAAG